MHVDFDWAGITAGNAVMRRVGAGPWRLDAVTYERLARDAGAPLRGSPAASAWGPGFAPALRRAGVRVPEAMTLVELLADLGP